MKLRPALLLLGLGFAAGVLSPAAAQEGKVIDVFDDQGEMSTGSVEIEALSEGPAPPDGSVATAPRNEPPEPSTWRAPRCLNQRSEVDRPDDSTRPQFRVLYVVPKDRKDEGHDKSGKICKSIQAVGKWMQKQSGGPSFRFDTYRGRLDVGFVRLQKTDAEIVGSDGGRGLKDSSVFQAQRILNELPNKKNTIYIVYYGGGSKYGCGSAPSPGRIAGIYLDGAPGGAQCRSWVWGDANRPQRIEFTVAHEIVHSLGFAYPSCPNYHDLGHVYDEGHRTPERDLMYVPKKSTDRWKDSHHPHGLILDIGRDDYFGHGRAGDPDMARSAYLSPTPPNPQMPRRWR